MRQYFISNRVFEPGNALPSSIVEADSFPFFKDLQIVSTFFREETNLFLFPGLHSYILSDVPLEDLSLFRDYC